MDHGSTNTIKSSEINFPIYSVSLQNSWFQKCFYKPYCKKKGLRPFDWKCFKSQSHNSISGVNSQKWLFTLSKTDLDSDSKPDGCIVLSRICSHCTWTRIPTPYFCVGQESESELVPGSVIGDMNEPSGRRDVTVVREIWSLKRIRLFCRKFSLWEKFKNRGATIKWKYHVIREKTTSGAIRLKHVFLFTSRDSNTNTL